MILDVNFDSCNDLVRLVTMCCCKFGQSLCMTCMGVKNTSKTQCNMTCFEMLLDVQALKILRRIPHKVIEKLAMHNFVAQPKALILICLLVPPNCTHVKAQDTPYVVTKVLMVCCKIQSSSVGENEGLGDRCGEALHAVKIEGQPSLKIDLSLMKPINIMAISNHSTE